MGERAALILVVASGCFEAYRDRDCAADTDCFPDEMCSQAKQCVTTPRASDGGGSDAVAPVAFSVRVFDRRSGEELPAATVNFDPNEGRQCDCPSRRGDPCELGVPPTGTIRVCAHAAGHQPCAYQAVPMSQGSLEVPLERCPADGPCDDLPGACGCEGVPTCGTQGAGE